MLRIEAFGSLFKSHSCLCFDDLCLCVFITNVRAHCQRRLDEPCNILNDLNFIYVLKKILTFP